MKFFVFLCLASIVIAQSNGFSERQQLLVDAHKSFERLGLVAHRNVLKHMQNLEHLTLSTSLNPRVEKSLLALAPVVFNYLSVELQNLHENLDKAKISLPILIEALRTTLDGRFTRRITRRTIGFTEGPTPIVNYPGAVSSTTDYPYGSGSTGVSA